MNLSSICRRKSLEGSRRVSELEQISLRCVTRRGLFQTAPEDAGPRAGHRNLGTREGMIHGCGGGGGEMVVSGRDGIGDHRWLYEYYITFMSCDTVLELYVAKQISEHQRYQLKVHVKTVR